MTSNRPQAVDAVRRLVHILDADREQKTADHLAHVIVVIDHQDPGRGDEFFKTFRCGLGEPNAWHIPTMRELDTHYPSIFHLGRRESVREN